MLLPHSTVSSQAACPPGLAAVQPSCGRHNIALPSCRLAWACLQEGIDLGSTILPALVRSLAAGAAGPALPAAPSGCGRLGFPGAAAAAGGAGGAAGAHAQWRAACRRLPLQLARLCSSGGFAAAVEAAIGVLGTHYVNAHRIRSQLPAVTPPIRSAALATLAQVRVGQLMSTLVGLPVIVHAPSYGSQQPHGC